MITENKVVSLNYTLRENNSEGLVLENTYEGQPLEFIYGKTNMMPSFEANIQELEAGNSFSFSIKSKEAYGEVNPNAIVDLDINLFKVNDNIDYEILKVGNSIPMQDSRGNRMNGIVIELSEDKVKMDFNHPLAGKDLHFEGEVISVREASEEELQAQHAHCGSHSHGDEGCGSENGGGCGCNCH